MVTIKDQIRSWRIPRKNTGDNQDGAIVVGAAADVLLRRATVLIAISGHLHSD
jgi:hypothetical protein